MQPKKVVDRGDEEGSDAEDLAGATKKRPVAVHTHAVHTTCLPSKRLFYEAPGEADVHVELGCSRWHNTCTCRAFLAPSPPPSVAGTSVAACPKHMRRVGRPAGICDQAPGARVAVGGGRAECGGLPMTRTKPGQLFIYMRVHVILARYRHHV